MIDLANKISGIVSLCILISPYVNISKISYYVKKINIAHIFCLEEEKSMVEIEGNGEASLQGGIEDGF